MIYRLKKYQAVARMRFEFNKKRPQKLLKNYIIINFLIINNKELDFVTVVTIIEMRFLPGGMYSGVPQNVHVLWPGMTFFANPKSTTRT